MQVWLIRLVSGDVVLGQIDSSTGDAVKVLGIFALPQGQGFRIGPMLPPFTKEAIPRIEKRHIMFFLPTNKELGDAYSQALTGLVTPSPQATSQILRGKA